MQRFLLLSVFGLLAACGGGSACPSGFARDEAAGRCVPVGDAGCVPGASQRCSTVGVGGCGMGTQSCAAVGVWNECQPSQPVPESCNGVDDDCNGTVDDGAAPSMCQQVSHAASVGCNAGACFLQCEAGWLNCDGEYNNGCEAQIGTIAACNTCEEQCTWACGGEGCDPIVELEAGAVSTAVRRQSGGVHVFGANVWSQGPDTGPGTRLLLPVERRNVGSMISLGWDHGCEITPLGRLSCYGGNSKGELGRPATNAFLPPGDVAGLSAVTHVSAGQHYTCAIRQQQAYCFGVNDKFQLGYSSDRQPSPTPSPVPGAFPVVSMDAGPNHACAVQDSGEVVCWGFNRYGQVNPADSSGNLARVEGLPDAQQLALSDVASCALDESGSVWCWGSNEAGVLALEDLSNRMGVPPTRVGLPRAARQICAGMLHACALGIGGEVWCWGYGGSGQLGRPLGGGRELPQAVAVTSATHIACHHSATCAATDRGVECWGQNLNGQLGTGDTTSSATPVRTIIPE